MNISVGKKIKELRIAKNITQSELAERVGVTVSAISSYEVSDRQPSYDVLIKTANLFNVTTDFLLGIENKNNVIDVTGLNLLQRNLIAQMISDYRALNYYKKIYDNEDDELKGKNNNT